MPFGCFLVIAIFSIETFYQDNIQTISQDNSTNGSKTLTVLTGLCYNINETFILRDAVTNRRSTIRDNGKDGRCQHIGVSYVLNETPGKSIRDCAAGMRPPLRRYTPNRIALVNASLP